MLSELPNNIFRMFHTSRLGYCVEIEPTLPEDLFDELHKAV